MQHSWTLYEGQNFDTVDCVFGMQECASWTRNWKIFDGKEVQPLSLLFLQNSCLTIWNNKCDYYYYFGIFLTQFYNAAQSVTLPRSDFDKLDPFFVVCSSMPRGLEYGMSCIYGKEVQEHLVQKCSFPGS